jgi:hypothetical protein
MFGSKRPVCAGVDGVVVGIVGISRHMNAPPLSVQSACSRAKLRTSKSFRSSELGERDIFFVGEQQQHVAMVWRPVGWMRGQVGHI